MNTLIGWLLIGLVIALFLTGVLASLWRRGGEQPRTGTKIMLILLRLAIGWHFFIEGMDKLHQPNWSSAGYLRESTGPLAPKFREMAGDSLVDMLTLQKDMKDAASLSPRLNQDWQDYLDAVTKFYGLDEKQAGETKKALDSLKDRTVQLLSKAKKLVEKPAPYPPTLKVALTMPERLKEYVDYQESAAKIERERLPQYGGDIHEEWKTAKSNAGKWRADLQKDLVLINKEMKRTLREELLRLALEKLPEDARKKLTAAVKKQRLLFDTELHGAYVKVFKTIGPEKKPIRLKKGHTCIIEMDSPEIACYLRLEDATGNKIAEDASGNLTARITYTVPKERGEKGKEPKEKASEDDTYRIVAGSYNLAVGGFTLLIKDKADEGVKPADLPDAKKAVLEFGKPFADKLTDKDPKDAVRSAARADDWEAIDKIKDKLDGKISDEYRKAFDAVEHKDKSLVGDPLIKLVRDNLLTRRRKGQPTLDPLPFAVAKPWRQWSVLDWSDHIVKYGITAVGAALLVGLLTRTACVAGAGFLLMFFLAMPPLPGLPESPRAEGHYLYINKNTIEMLALLVLATTPSGRWVGLDGLLRFLCPSSWQSAPDAVKM